MSSKHHVTALYQYSAYGNFAQVIGCSCGELLMDRGKLFTAVWEEHIAAQKAEEG